MLDLGAELDKALSPIEISMIINDAEILYKNHIEQLIIPRVVEPFTADEVVNELKENDTLDDAIDFFNSQK
tara:strand:- start:860 stop:1072 length:213 start_codon:yes stop_codon:yes gene_type:complete